MATTSATNERIGFIGVGLMGHGMAKNIVDKGYRLTVLGRANRPPIDDLDAARRDRSEDRERGGRVARRWCSFA